MAGKRKQSLQQKLALVFTVIIIIIVSIMLVLHIRTMNLIRRLTYEKMNSQAEYYQQTLETEIGNILNLQLEFFNNRQLPFLAAPDAGLSAYEKREAVLSVQERIRTITEVSGLIQDGILYIPGSGYYISKGDIRRMDEKDAADMEGYLEDRTRKLQFDGENFYAVRTGDTGSVNTRNPKFVFVLIFSSRQVEERLAMLNASEEGGVFLYQEAEQVMLESGTAEGVGRIILENLQRDGDGNYINIQRIRAQGEDYLALAGEAGEMGVFVQYVKEAPLLAHVYQSWNAMVAALAVLIAISAVFVLYTRKIVHKPLNILVQAFKRVKEGNLEEHIYHGANDEFTYLYQEFNEMEDRLAQLIDEVYVQKNLAQRAQLKQLQAQINPHFLYNSFFILSRRIKRQDYENAEEFAGHLGSYFKYLTRDGSDYIPLKQEVEHAKSYAAIQQVRFANRVKVQFEELPEEYGGMLVPRLILQPLLENSFGHGLENKVCDGILRVGFAAEEGGIRICVEDNGEEARDEDIRRMQKSLDGRDSEEITGIVNIHKRLQIYFHGNAGLLIERSALGGVAITIEIRMEREGKA